MTRLPTGPERAATPAATPAATTAAPPPPKRRRGLRLSMIPTIVTLGNTVCGVLAISWLIDAGRLSGLGQAAAASEKIVAAGWIILAGMICDAIDGSVARLTRSTSNFGGQLDSLADVLTFGVAPALLAKTLAEGVFQWSHPRAAFVTAGFYAVCATLRLARYNAEHDEPDEAVRHFGGLPTPGAAGVIAGIAMAHPWLVRWLSLEGEASQWAARVLCYGALLGLGILMVSRVPYAHFVNRFLRGKRPIGRVAFVALALVLGFANDMPEVVLAGGFLLYALSGPLLVIPNVLRRRREALPELLDA